MDRKLAANIIEYILKDGNYRCLTYLDIPNYTQEDIILTCRAMKKENLINDFREYNDKENSYATGIVTDDGKDYWQDYYDNSLFGRIIYCLKYKKSELVYLFVFLFIIYQFIVCRNDLLPAMDSVINRLFAK